MLSLLIFVGEAVRDAFDPRKGEWLMALLAVDDLSVAFPVGRPARRGGARRLASISTQGETLALVGESGSGKSVTALSILQLLPYPAGEPRPRQQHPLRGPGAGRRAASATLRASAATASR